MLVNVNSYEALAQANPYMGGLPVRTRQRRNLIAAAWLKAAATVCIMHLRV